MKPRDIKIVDFTPKQKKEMKEAMDSIKKRTEEKIASGIKLNKIERLILNKPTKLEKVTWYFETLGWENVIEKCLIWYWLVSPTLCGIFFYFELHMLGEFFLLTFVGCWVIIALMGWCGSDSQSMVAKDISWLDL